MVLQLLVALVQGMALLQQVEEQLPQRQLQALLAPRHPYHSNLVARSWYSRHIAWSLRMGCPEGQHNRREPPQRKHNVSTQQDA